MVAVRRSQSHSGGAAASSHPALPTPGSTRTGRASSVSCAPSWRASTSPTRWRSGWRRMSTPTWTSCGTWSGTTGPSSASTPGPRRPRGCAPRLQLPPGTGLQEPRSWFGSLAAPLFCSRHGCWLVRTAQRAPARPAPTIKYFCRCCWVMEGDTDLPPPCRHGGDGVGSAQLGGEGTPLLCPVGGFSCSGLGPLFQALQVLPQTRWLCFFWGQKRGHGEAQPQHNVCWYWSWRLWQLQGCTFFCSMRTNHARQEPGGSCRNTGQSGAPAATAWLRGTGGTHSPAAHIPVQLQAVWCPGGCPIPGCWHWAGEP